MIVINRVIYTNFLLVSESLWFEEHSMHVKGKQYHHICTRVFTCVKRPAVTDALGFRNAQEQGGERASLKDDDGLSLLAKCWDSGCESEGLKTLARWKRRASELWKVDLEFGFELVWLDLLLNTCTSFWKKEKIVPLSVNYFQNCSRITEEKQSAYESCWCIHVSQYWSRNKHKWINNDFCTCMTH